MQLPKPASEPQTPVSAEPADLVYDLRRDGCSDEFHAQCGRFADRVLAEADEQAGATIGGYSRFLREELEEVVRSEGEFVLELLMLGLFLRRYGDAARRTPAWVVRLARITCGTQHAWPKLKPLAGLARAVALSPFIAQRQQQTQTGVEAASSAKAAPVLPGRRPALSHLIEWLSATGEFDAEVKRLANWLRYLETLSAEEAEQALMRAEGLFDWFASEAARELGGFTRGVEQFLMTEHTRRGMREDLLFCFRDDSEYHLNMIAAAIMNRGLREKFERSRRRVVLVPGCMRGHSAARCCAHGEGLDLQCSACDPECAVNRITQQMRSLGAQVYLVPHSTGFTRWLNRWQHEPETGVTAVACLLHILPGGLEMRARHIAAQCLPLDYPGCQKHWRRESVPTALNEKQLVQIVSAQVES